MLDYVIVSLLLFEIFVELSCVLRNNFPLLLKILQVFIKFIIVNFFTHNRYLHFHFFSLFELFFKLVCAEGCNVKSFWK